MKALVIYNPISGREVFKNEIARVKERLSIKYEVDVYATKGTGDATKIASENVKDYDLYVVAGGDGTLHEVICGIGHSSEQITIGYIPAGTVNDFANTVGIPTNIDKAIDIILNTEPTLIDVGRINDSFFVYVAAFGAFTRVSYATPSKLKKKLGPAAYFISAITEIKDIKSLYLELDVNGEKISGNYYLGLFVNSKGVASFKNVLPEAKLNDGLIDIILVPKTKGIVLPDLIDRFINGFRTNRKSKKLVHVKTDKFTMKSNFDITFNIDGEAGIVSNYVEVECLRNHIKLHISDDVKKEITI